MLSVFTKISAGFPHSMYEFHIILTIQSDYFPMQNQRVDKSNGNT
jgi:hypothetical protein